MNGEIIGNNSSDAPGQKDLDGKDVPKLEVSQRNYGDMSQDEHQRALDNFNEKVEKAYDAIVNPLVAYINSHARDPKDRIKMLFDYLTADNKVYDMGAGTTLDGEMAIAKTYSLPGQEHEGFKYPQNTKYPAILNDVGNCSTYSEAFKDIADNLNIPCIRVNGRTSMEHAWNAVYLDGEVIFIDVAYAIMNRRFQDKNNYFFKSMDELVRAGGSRTIDKSSMEELFKFVQKHKELNSPKIEIHNRTDTPLKIEIHGPTDVPPRISLEHRGDKPSINVKKKG